jgi:hypothetical protein
MKQHNWKIIQSSYGIKIGSYEYSTEAFLKFVAIEGFYIFKV